MREKKNTTNENIKTQSTFKHFRVHDDKLYSNFTVCLHTI